MNGHLRVGTLADPEVLRLGEVLAHAVERHPLLQLELKHEISGAAFAKVRDGELDASFYYGPLDHPSVAAISLRPLDFRIAVPAAWNVPVREPTGRAIAALPWVMTPPISSHHALASRFFDASGQAPATTIEADNELVVRSLVTAGVGVGLMREDLAQQAERAGEVAIWPGVRLATTLEFITPRDRAARAGDRRAPRAGRRRVARGPRPRARRGNLSADASRPVAARPGARGAVRVRRPRPSGPDRRRCRPRRRPSRRTRSARSCR